MVAPTLPTLFNWIIATLGDDYPPPTNSIWQAGDGRPIRRLGLAIAGSAAVARQAEALSLDALIVHRPWGLPPLPPERGLIALHEALDDRLTTGRNPWLAKALGFQMTDTLLVDDRPLLSFAVSERPMTQADVLACLLPWFTPQLWNAQPPDTPIAKIVLGLALRPTLLALAAEHGAQLYITGTLRPSVRPFLQHYTYTIVGLGHAPIERWGLCWLGRALQATFNVELFWLDGECGDAAMPLTLD